MIVRTYPRSQIAVLDPTEPFIWISITDPGKSYVERPASFTDFEHKSLCVARLCLSFWDSEDIDQMPGGFWTQENPPPKLPLHELELFQPWQAARIIQFVWEHRYEAELLVINCEGGLSRSPQVANALTRLFEGLVDPSQAFTARIPTLLQNAALDYEAHK